MRRLAVALALLLALCAQGARAQPVIGPQWTEAVVCATVGTGANFFGTGNTITNPTIWPGPPAYIQWNNHGLQANDPVAWWWDAGSLPTPFVPFVPIYVLASGLTANTFQIAATPGGTPINIGGVNSGTHILSSWCPSYYLTSPTSNTTTLYRLALKAGGGGCGPGLGGGGEAGKMWTDLRGIPANTLIVLAVGGAGRCTASGGTDGLQAWLVYGTPGHATPVNTILMAVPSGKKSLNYVGGMGGDNPGYLCQTYVCVPGTSHGRDGGQGQPRVMIYDSAGNPAGIGAFGGGRPNDYGSGGWYDPLNGYVNGYLGEGGIYCVAGVGPC